MANRESGRNPRVLMILNNAPDYREPFLRTLAATVDLTVVARPCESDQLTPPVERIGYRYIEIAAKRKWGAVWQPGLGGVVDSEAWDIVCSSINMRDFGRLWVFFRRRQVHRSWIWWGHIFGHTTLPGLEIVRGMALRRSAGALTFNEGIAADVEARFGIPARSFNNTQVQRADFREPSFPELEPEHGTDTPATLNLLFVGRNQSRKRLDRLVELAKRRREVSVRLVGPGMDTLDIPADLQRSGRISVFGRTVGPALDDHFDWAHLVANPGHVGLLVMNTAQHGKGIVIDSSSDHAPEYWLAREAEQPFIDFSQPAVVDAFVDDLLDPTTRGRTIRRWGARLQTIARERYTIEHMAAVHVNMFREIAAGGGWA